MAAVNKVKATALLIKVGNGASPEVFTALCTINAQRGLSIAATTSETAVPDCADPDLPAWLDREKVSISADVNGAGTLHSDDLQTCYNLISGSAAVNLQIVLDVAGAVGGRTFEGAFHMTQFEVSGTKGELVNATMAFQSTGTVNCTANP